MVVSDAIQTRFVTDTERCDKKLSKSAVIIGFCGLWFFAVTFFFAYFPVAQLKVSSLSANKGIMKNFLKNNKHT